VIVEETEKIRLGLESGTLVKCALCDEVGSSLALHVRKIHNIDKKEYIKIHGPVLASASREKYSKAYEENGSWIIKAKERGEDLTEYWKKVSDGVRAAIMNSPEERKRRSNLLGSLNKTDAFRKKASDTAKITSARKDIQQNRSIVLSAWRDKNPEDFYNKCVKMMHSYKSKPEQELFKILLSMFPSLCFKNNQFLHNKKYFVLTKSNRKQIDIISESKSIMVEYDGKYHFDAWDKDITELARKKDIILSNYSIDKKLTLIRVSLDTYSYRVGKGFSQPALDKIKELIDNPTPGVHFIGKSWNGQDYTHITSKEEILKIYGA
jgi:hypothetical protein